MKFNKIIEDYFQEKNGTIKYRYLTPPGRLNNFIEGYIIGELHTELFTHHVYRPVPSGNVSMVIQYGDIATSYDPTMRNPLRYSTFVIGLFPLTKPFYSRFPKHMKSVMTVFKPGGFCRLFGYPAMEIRSQMIDMELVAGYEINRVREQLFLSNSTQEKFRIMNDFFTLQLNINKERTLRCNAITSEIIQQKGNIRMAELSDKFSTSKKNIERSFHREVGVGPKEYTRIVRFNSVYTSLSRQKFNDVSESIFQMGYYDQPHFINEFKGATGYTPTEFAQHRPDIRSFTDRLFIKCDNIDIGNTDRVK